MVLNSKIEAIKAIREAASHATIEKNDQTGRFEIRCGLGLKEAKDLYEAIEGLVVRAFVTDLAHTSQVARGILVMLANERPDSHPQ